MAETLGKISKMHATVLGAIGLILVVAGVAIITIPGAPMRGSGLGTASLVAGIVLLIIAALRLKRAR